MGKTVTKFPGNACFHYTMGHCLREERMNPGLHRQWRCKVLTAWEQEYERYLDRIDRFKLDTETARLIWEKRMHELMVREPDCPDRVEPVRVGCESCGEQPVVPCGHLWVELCTRMLPVCEGICKHFDRK